MKMTIHTSETIGTSASLIQSIFCWFCCPLQEPLEKSEAFYHRSAFVIGRLLVCSDERTRAT
jgi:hypothetical protein